MKHARRDYNRVQDLREIVALMLETAWAKKTPTLFVLGKEARETLEAVAEMIAERFGANPKDGHPVPAEEPVFLIRGQDAVGADAVRLWAGLAAAVGADPVTVRLALEQASRMAKWPRKQLPDAPGYPQEEDGEPDGYIWTRLDKTDLWLAPLAKHLALMAQGQWPCAGEPCLPQGPDGHSEELVEEARRILAQAAADMGLLLSSAAKR